MQVEQAGPEGPPGGSVRSWRLQQCRRSKVRLVLLSVFTKSGQECQGTLSVKGLAPDPVLLTIALTEGADAIRSVEHQLQRLQWKPHVCMGSWVINIVVPGNFHVGRENNQMLQPFGRAECKSSEAPVCVECEAGVQLLGWPARLSFIIMRYFLGLEFLLLGSLLRQDLTI